MRDCIHEMHCHREKAGITWSEIASRTMRDVRTATRQLDEEANPTLETLEMYAKALGGSIHFLPDGWSLNQADNFIRKIEEQATRIGKLEEENRNLKAKVVEQQETMSSRLKLINELQVTLTKVVEKLLEKV